MANTQEIAVGLAAVLKSSSVPEPLPVTLRGQSLADAALLIRAVIRECTDARIALHKIKVGTELLHHLDDGHLPGRSYLGVQVIGDHKLGSEVLLYRQEQ